MFKMAEHEHCNFAARGLNPPRQNSNEKGIFTLVASYRNSQLSSVMFK